MPIFSALFLGRVHPASTWAAAAAALCGTVLLANDGGAPTAGDGWSIAAAAASAGFILRLEALSTQGGAGGSRAITATSTATVAVLALCWTFFAALAEPPPGSSDVVGAEVLSALVPATHLVEQGASAVEAVSTVRSEICALTAESG